jgi:hypothetical protein
MAEFEKEEFTFPDEEPKGKPQEMLADGEVDIIIEDDTPAEDRNVEPMPEKIVKKLEAADESTEELDPKTQKERLLQYKKVWNDERRAKDAANREREEAIQLARRVLEENKKLKETLSTGEKSYIQTVQSNADLGLNAAKQEYRAALESGEADRIVEAQTALTEATYKVQQAKNYQPTPLQENENEVQLQQVEQQTPKVDPKTQSWLDQNPWYGAKKAMSSYAVGVHEELVDEYGKDVIGTDQYFRRIDQTMRKKFPEYFETLEGSPAESEREAQTATAKTKPSTVVAPATRSTSSKQIRLKQSQMSIIKRLGISPEQYAREQNKLEI